MFSTCPATKSNIFDDKSVLKPEPILNTFPKYMCVLISRVREELAEEILAEMIETPLSPIAPGGDSSLRKDGEKIEDAGMYLAYAVIVIIILLNFAVYATFDGVGSYVPYFPSN